MGREEAGEWGKPTAQTVGKGEPVNWGVEMCGDLVGGLKS